MTKAQIIERYGRFEAVMASKNMMQNLRAAETHDQADAWLETRACQIIETGYSGRQRATPAEHDWAKQIAPDGTIGDDAHPLLTLCGPHTLGADWDGIERA
jgi:hypothetical protein